MLLYIRSQYLVPRHKYLYLNSHSYHVLSDIICTCIELLISDYSNIPKGRLADQILNNCFCLHDLHK